MKTFLVGFAIVVATTSLVARQQTLELQTERQKGLLETLLDFASKENLQAQVKRIKELLGRVNPGKPLGPDIEVQIMREVETRFKPVPIVGGVFAPHLTQEPFAQYQQLTLAQQATLLALARSVARIEIATVGTVFARGTGFVVGSDLIATNCHVLATIASQQADGAWRLRSGVRAHFPDGPEHDASREFQVTAIAALPVETGLDVALLRVSTRSMDGSAALPPALTLRATKLTPNWPPDRGFPVALVGYPNLATSTEVNYQELRKRGDFAKVHSPGAIMDVATIDSIDILNHLAGTTDGSSGSPLFSLDNFDVVGIHNCCNAAGTPPPATMPCAQLLKAAAVRNHAIAAASILANPTLKALF